MSDHLIQSDARHIPLRDGTVQCVVTSPPYWGLRDYGTASWEGGEAGCDHRSPTMREGRNEDRPKLAGSEATNQAQLLLAHRTGCGKCGAVKIDAQLGLEPTPDLYVEHMVQVFREVRRVLRDDGTLWLNLGDSYAGSGKGPSDNSPLDRPYRGMSNIAAAPNRWLSVPDGIKQKDLVGIPWMVAFALRTDGWYLRSDIIWAKPNPMPESVTDRPTKAHEYLFLLTKRERYYYDADAIREPHSWNHGQPIKHWTERPNNGAESMKSYPPGNTTMGFHENGRNRRSVWTIATEPYPEAHFATFPTDLVKPCVMAGTSEKGACSECGAPWERETETAMISGRRDYGSVDKYVDLNNGRAGTSEKRTTGWRPTCAHDEPTRPCIVLDPFAGSGTTVMVAKDLGRHAIGLDLKPDYLRLAQNRTRQGAFVL